MKREKRKPQAIPESREVVMKPHTYQPSKADLEEEIDMPGLSESEAFEPLSAVSFS